MLDQVILLDKTAAGVICEMKDRHGSMLSTLKCTKDVLGIVASLGKVGDENLSRLVFPFKNSFRSMLLFHQVSFFSYL